MGTSAWVRVTQEAIAQFAQATGDHQWIHVDVERAATGPFGVPIAHGFLTLSLIPQFFDSALCIANVRMGVNYGLNRVRFMAPVPAGSRVRGVLKLLDATPVENNGFQLTWDVTFEGEHVTKPVCVAECITRLYA